MVINLSNETIETVYNSLRATKKELDRSYIKASEKHNYNSCEIIENQLTDVEDALEVFEELLEVI